MSSCLKKVFVHTNKKYYFGGSFMRKIITVLMALALILAAAGCGGGSSNGGEPTVITNLVVKAGDAVVAEDSTITIAKGETKTLTAAADGATSFNWRSATPAIAVFDPGNAATFTGTTAVVIGLVTGTSEITVTASDGTASAVRKFKVTVTEVATDFEVRRGVAAVEDNGTIEINPDEDTEFSIAFTPTGASTGISWSSDNAAVTVTPNSGPLVVIRGTASETATITATAAALSKTVTFTVNVRETAIVISTLPWSWAKTPAWTSLANGNNNRFFSAGHEDVTVRVYGGTIGNDNGGIRLGGTGTTGPARLVIGQYDNLPTAAKGVATVSPINGDFDLAEGPVKVTIEYENMVAATADRYLLRVYVNNNGTGGDASFLGTASNIVSYWKSSSSNEPKLSDISGTIEVIIDPSTFAADQLPALEKAFICLHAQQSNSTTEDNGLTITSITIDRIQTAGIVINPETDFTGFPTDTFTLNTATPSHVITLTGSGYTTADWYINGAKQSPSGMSFTVTKGTLVAGEHTLTAVVTVDGQLYSKSVKFTVAE